jgi:hypothetical protein
VKLTPKEIALGAGLGVGAFVYWRQSKPPDCTGIGGQTLAAAIAGAATHPLEDFLLGLVGIADLEVQADTLGAVKPGWAASFYSWWHGLTPDQQAAVKAASDSGAEACAAIETASQVASGASALLSAALAGALAYFAAGLIWE